ncbi:peptidoglycan-binding domain-containing protein [Curtobacterium sp. VKM Ac-1376]|uniref:peptidoglycan-binding domain-containing protein n=1 Tax=Curtobacterium sp. VKM Ac-1376 TaxID=123312 RepID=UPI00188C9C88|nr:peptidoglycan-binding domain-containing protein [Curtobacterium sp. VKM Ac-1376]MBF4615490.1 N-acetylmuramoyl-L-alanine amidase [Curtobacterium sp. VKM Ac-1376]
MDIVTRTQWGSTQQVFNAGTVTPAQRVGVVVHHSVTGEGGSRPAVEDLLRMIERLDRDTNHWPGTYNFAIDYAGRVYEMSGRDGIGTHTAGHNTAYWGICYIGDGSKAYPAAAQRAATELISQLTLAAGHPLQVLGHRDLNTTECPGALIEATLHAIATDNSPLAVDGRLGHKTISCLQQRLREKGLYDGPLDGRIDVTHSDTVAALQTYLNAHGAHLVVDGEGLWQTGRPSATIAALQAWLGTPADGVLDLPTSSAVKALQARLNGGSL